MILELDLVIHWQRDPVMLHITPELYACLFFMLE